MELVVLVAPIYEKINVHNRQEMKLTSLLKVLGITEAVFCWSTNIPTEVFPPNVQLADHKSGELIAKIFHYFSEIARHG